MLSGADPWPELAAAAPPLLGQPLAPPRRLAADTRMDQTSSNGQVFLFLLGNKYN